MIAHLWQSTLFAAVAGLLVLLLRRNRARTRYWVWLAALAKFLVPFGVLVSVGGHMNPPRWTPKVPSIVEPAISFVMGGDIGEPTLTTAMVARQTTNYHLPAILFVVWACGFAAILFCWVRRWMRVRGDVRAASRLSLEIGILVVSSPVLREPGVFGIFRPVLMLPEGMAQHLTKDEWEAILAHELCHVRCYDNLTAAIYMLVESIFWFHPLVWWLGTRLVDERELACDEEVLRLGSEPMVYAQGILKVCELYLESPLACVAGVTGSNLRRRIRAIMIHRGTERMSLGKKLVLAVVGILAAVMPLVVGVINERVILAQSQPAGVRPKFEVASVRPCDRGGGPNERGGGGTSSPGRLTLTCQSVSGLIDAAYVMFANGIDSADPGLVYTTPVEGGPGWINSERYTINAKAEGNASDGMMQGPMLQSLLEDRFKLKIRREIREVPVYALTVAKGGPKLQPFKEGTCVPQPEVITFPPTPPPAGQRYCVRGGRPGGPNRVLDQEGITIDEFCKTFLSGSPVAGLDRRVIDKTGLTGKFNIHVEFAPSSDALARMRARGKENGEPTAPSLQDALQEQLGLKLESTKGRGEFYVIEHVERPSEN